MNTQNPITSLSPESISNYAAAILADMADAVSIQDRSFRVLYQNRAHRDLAGDHVGEYCYQVYAKSDRVCDDCPVALSYSDGGHHRQERHISGERGERHVEISASPLRDAQGRIVAGVEVVRDIADRWRTEQELRKERNFVNTIQNTVDSLVLVLDRDGRIVRFNRACELLTGYTFDEVRDRYVWDYFILPEEIDGVRKVFANLKAGMFPNRHVNCWRTRDGGRRLISWSNTALVDSDGSVQYVVPTGLDVTEQKRSEDALAAEKERLAVTLRSIGDGVITTDTGGRIVLMNKVAEDLTGYRQEEAAGRHIEEVFHLVHERTRARVQAPVEQVIRTGRAAELANHTVLVGRDGREYVISDSAAPIRDGRGTIIGVVLVFRDMTEKRILEQEVLKTQKMESLSILAGGIAHDYNNLLMAILGNVNLANALLSEGRTGTARERLADAERASLRAKDLTRQLLTFSKGGAPVKKTTAPGELVREAVALSMRGASVRSEVSIPADLWMIEADEGQISQVLNNLIINAIQSCGDSGGTIAVRCENIAVPSDGGQRLAAGNYVVISIRDTGCGIPPEHLPRIFDPYFTTKDKGIGLGLATSYAIVNRHDGLITVESEPGKGTAFQVYLPANPAAAACAGSSELRDIRGSGRILIMDDEEIVRTVTASMLQNLGYTVETTEDGAEAVRRYIAARDAGTSFDAVILDATIPGGVGGKEAMKELLRVDPEVRVILTSGYTSDDLLVQHREHGFRDVIQKPYTMADLGAVVRRVLGG